MTETELLQQLIAINSENPPGNEKQIALFIRDFLQDLKIPTQMMRFGKNRYNLIAFIGKGRGLMLNGHMDTVPVGKPENWKFDPFGQIKGRRIYGRGAVDMKGGLASVLTATKKLIKSNVKFKKKLLLTFVGDEEVAGMGSKHLIEKMEELLKDIRYGVIAEPTNLTITRAQKGTSFMKVVVMGRAAHGSRPALGDNAIYKACDIIQEIRKLIGELKKTKDPILGSGSINVGKIAGGIKVNVVPDYCEIEIDRRIVPGETPKLAKGQIEKILKRLKIKADVKMLTSRLPMVIPENSKLIALIKSITGTKTKGEAGYTEAELFYRDCGIECAVCGPGNVNLCHVADEYIKISALKKGTSVYEKLIRKCCC